MKAIRSQFLLIIGLAFLDQLIKYIVRFFGRFYVCNRNLAFGLPISQNIFIFIWIVIFAVFIKFAYDEKNTKNILGYNLILAGALGNILDRLFFGCVIDFINLRIWPAFNLADVFITIGIAIIIFHKIKTKNNI